MSRIVLGWQEDALKSGRDRWLYQPKQRIANALTYEGEGHLVTFAPTGAGKGRNVIIPNLLSYDGPTIVVDPKGENVDVTANYRKRFGPVYVLDPFRISKWSGQGDSLNPFDLILRMDGSVPSFVQESRRQEAIKEIASMFYPRKLRPEEEYWYKGAIGIILAAIFMLVTDEDTPQDQKHLGSIKKMISSPDFLNETRQKVADKEMPDFVISAMSTVLQGGDTNASSYMPSIANSMLDVVSGDLVIATMKNSTIDLSKIVSGENCTIYLVIPPQNLESHAPLLRIWILTLMLAIMRRESIPKNRTLFLLDECANIGHLESLQKAITLLRGYGLQAWMFFQDLGQLQAVYPAEWTTIVNNCAVVQAFGTPTPMSAKALNDILAVSESELLTMDRSKQVLRVAHHAHYNEAGWAGRCDYLRDGLFRGKFDDNLRYRK